MTSARRRLHRLVVLAAVGGALCAAPGRALAQPVSQAEVTKLTGRVEVQRKGDSQWSPTAQGARLSEGDEIRAHAGANAELRTPDGSTVIVAENSRLVVGRLEFDARSNTRTALFHLVVGKARAAVEQAAVTLVRARQSNFVITTPTAVAAVRGTLYEVTYDATLRVMRVAVLVKDPARPDGIVSCSSLIQGTGTGGAVLVREGLASTATTGGGCSPPVPIFRLPDAGNVGTLRNPIIPPASAFSGPVTVPNVPLSGPAPAISTGFPGINVNAPEPPSTLGANQTPASQPANR